MGKGKNPKNNDNCLYFDISSQERDAALNFLLSVLLRVRKEEGFPSNHFVFDEDVNVYLAHLLFAISLPEYHDMAAPYISNESSEILDWVRATDDKTIRYFIFKVNADRLLIHTAIFDDIHARGKGRFFQRSPRYYQELARLYYDQAAAYHKRIYRKQTGVGDVLQKIAGYYESYEGLLKRVRKEYFGFVNGFRDQAFRHFVSHLNTYERDVRRKQSMDQFLDFYGRWLADKNPRWLPPLFEVVKELRLLDPQFEFDERKLFGDNTDLRKCA